jgi:hypothetical protein
MNNYYTYAYLREDGTPYYIGKGRGNRIYCKQGRPCNSPPRDRIIKLKQNLTEEEAFKHEIYMITIFGRKDLGTGILYNRTNGGEGASATVPNEKTKDRKCWNNGMKNVFSKKCPGEGWVRGMIGDSGHKGLKCWNNGRETRLCKECPGDGWIRGRIDEWKWWNNGVKSIKSKKCPGEGWKRGRMLEGLIYWTDGVKNIRSRDCPGEGWRKGLTTIGKGLKCWNDGNKTIRSRECPGKGWVRGRLSNKKI